MLGGIFLPIGGGGARCLFVSYLVAIRFGGSPNPGNSREAPRTNLAKRFGAQESRGGLVRGHRGVARRGEVSLVHFAKGC